MCLSSRKIIKSMTVYSYKRVIQSIIQSLIQSLIRNALLNEQLYFRQAMPLSSNAYKTFFTIS